MKHQLTRHGLDQDKPAQNSIHKQCQPTPLTIRASRMNMATHGINHGILSVLAANKITFNQMKPPENNNLLKWKNAIEIIINYKEIRMVKDGED